MEAEDIITYEYFPFSPLDTWENHTSLAPEGIAM
jgi:hypothetical protein